MSYQLPHTNENVIGEKLTFLRKEQGPDGEVLLCENYVQPGAGVPMHVHFLQEEALTVVTGRIGYQIKGEGPRFAEPGDSVVFAKGVAHRFWNAGEDVLHCTGYLKPANTIVFYLSSIYAAQNKAGSARPEMFDAAYLMTRYSAEYDMTDIPWLVKKIVVPITYFIGKLLGKYSHFKNAPEPVKA